MVGEDLAKALKQCAKQLEDASEDESPKHRLFEFGTKLKNALQDIWNERTIDVFDSGYAILVTLHR